MAFVAARGFKNGSHRIVREVPVTAGKKPRDGSGPENSGSICQSESAENLFSRIKFGHIKSTCYSQVD